MCGIAGEALAESGRGYDDAGNRERVVRAMLRAMTHRGPDSADVAAEGLATMGCCRLAIVDIANGHQPMSSRDGRYTIVYNGECYELDELRTRLRGAGVEFRTKSDTEVVLEAYARWGAPCLEYLNGMFALAIWDGERRQLFLARDRFGIKPLYYTRLPERLIFASTLDAIAAREDVSLSIDLDAAKLVLVTRSIPAPRTVYRNAWKLLPGHYAVFRNGYFRTSPWWDLPLEADGPRAESRSAAVVRLDGLLDRATRMRQVSDRPVGLCLSGGIDSGLIGSYMPRGTRSFSLGFDYARCDETRAAQTTADHLGLDHHALRFTARPEQLLDDVVAHLDEPLADSSALALLALSQCMRDHVTVVLSGSGGDELFSGYLRHAVIRFYRSAARLPGTGRAMRGLAGLPSAFGSDLGRRFLVAASRDPVSCFVRLIAPTTDGVLRRLLRRDQDGDAVLASADDVYRKHFDRARGWPLLHRLSYLETKTVLPDTYLVKEDRMSMAASLEGRFPMLDYRLAEWAFRLPSRDRLRGMRTKQLLRDLAARRLPSAIAHAPKRGFEVPLGAWFRGPLWDRAHDQLLRPSAAVHAYCEPREIQRLLAEHTASRADHGRILYALLVLESWHDRHSTTSSNTTASNTMPRSTPIVVLGNRTYEDSL